LNKVCAADYSEAGVEWDEWAVEDSVLTLGKTVTSINFIWRFASQEGSFPISCYNSLQGISLTF